MSFSANWISLAVVVVVVSLPAMGFKAPVESKMSVLSGVTGTEKLAWLRILKISVRNWMLKSGPRGCGSQLSVQNPMSGAEGIAKHCVLM